MHLLFMKKYQLFIQKIKFIYKTCIKIYNNEFNKRNNKTEKKNKVFKCVTKMHGKLDQRIEYCIHSFEFCFVQHRLQKCFSRKFMINLKWIFEEFFLLSLEFERNLGSFFMVGAISPNIPNINQLCSDSQLLEKCTEYYATYFSKYSILYEKVKNR